MNTNILNAGQRLVSSLLVILFLVAFVPFANGQVLPPVNPSGRTTLSPAEVAYLQTKYADLHLAANLTDSNYTVIDAQGLTASQFQASINTAAANNRWLVVRTDLQHTVTLDGQALSINNGNVTIVSLGANNLIIDADQRSRVFVIDTNAKVGLGGLKITRANGAGVRNNGGTLLITGCEVSENRNTGVSSSSGVLTVRNSTISNNVDSVGNGRGIDINISSNLTVEPVTVIENCTISNNLFGIYHLEGGGTLTITSSAIVGNGDRIFGGGIVNINGTMSIANSAIVNNGRYGLRSETQSGSPRALTITNCTIAKNHSGIWAESCAVIINNSIVVDNDLGGWEFRGTGYDVALQVNTGSIPPGRITGGSITGSNNFFGNGAIRATTRWTNLGGGSYSGTSESQPELVSGNITGTGTNPIDPRITAPFQRADGHWIYAMPLQDSGAINAGNNTFATTAGLTHDLAGNSRFVGTVDIGAYEYASSLPPPPTQPLAMPALTALTAVDSATLSATWTRVNNAVRYEIQFCTDSNDSLLTLSVPQPPSGTTVTANLGGLQPRRTHYVRVVAIGNGAVYTNSMASNILERATLPLDPPPFRNVTAISSSEIKVEWDAVPHATGYTIQYATNSAFTGAVTVPINSQSTTSTNITDCSPNTLYYVRIRATAEHWSGDSAYSDPETAVTLCNAPTGLTGTPGTTNVSLTWGAPTGGATSYRVERSPNGTTGWAQIATVSTLSYNDNNPALTPDMPYSYRVFAVNSAGVNSAQSSNVFNTRTLPTTPPLVPDLATVSTGSTRPDSIVRGNSFSVTAGTIQNIGTAASGGYRVTFYASTSVPTAATITSGIELGFVDMPSLAASATASPAATLNVSTTNSALLTGTSYYIGWWITPVTDETNTSNNWAYNTSAMSVTSQPTKLSTPTLNALTEITSNSMRATWNAIPHATTYRVRAATDASYSNIVKAFDVSDGATTTTVIDGLSPNTLYYVQVFAKGDGTVYTNSAWSSSKTATTTAAKLATPTLNALTEITGNSMRATWNAIPHATTYRVRAATDANYTNIVKAFDVSSTTTTVIDGLSPNTLYYVQVFAKGDGTVYTNSAWSSSKTATTLSTVKLATPTLNALTEITGNSMRATWNAIPHATTYRVRAATDASYSNIVKAFDVSSGATTTTVIDGLSPNTLYYVQVYAKGDGTVYTNSAWSSSKTATTLPPAAIKLATPTLNALTEITSNSMRATWNAIPNATTYRVRAATDANYSNIVKAFDVSGGATTTTVIDGLSPNTLYYVQVYAKGDGTVYTNSAWSSSKTATTLPPAAIKLATPTLNALTEITSNSMRATWNAIPNATTYRVRAATDANYSNIVKAFDVSGGATTTTVIDGLSPNTLYYVQVFAKGDGTVYTNSAWSASKSATTNISGQSAANSMFGSDLLDANDLVTLPIESGGDASTSKNPSQSAKDSSEKAFSDNEDAEGEEGEEGDDVEEMLDETLDEFDGCDCSHMSKVKISLEALALSADNLVSIEDKLDEAIALLLAIALHEELSHDAVKLYWDAEAEMFYLAFSIDLLLADEWFLDLLAAIGGEVFEGCVCSGLYEVPVPAFDEGLRDGFADVDAETDMFRSLFREWLKLFVYESM